MNHYFAKVSARVRCGYCDERVIVTVAEEIDCDMIALDDLGDGVSEAITDQQESDGWGYGGQYCPDCMATHAKAIAAMETADDYELP